MHMQKLIFLDFHIVISCKFRGIPYHPWEGNSGVLILDFLLIRWLVNEPYFVHEIFRI